MKNPDILICEVIESIMNEIIMVINRTCSIFEADKLHSGLRILDWILYQVCSNEIKKFEWL
jgi:hypothetical protein